METNGNGAESPPHICDQCGEESGATKALRCEKRRNVIFKQVIDIMRNRAIVTGPITNLIREGESCCTKAPV